MSETPRIVVGSRSGISPEKARDIRANAWSYIFSCYEKHKAAGCDWHHDGDETKEGSKNDFRPNDIIQR